MNRLSQLFVASQIVILATPAFANPIAMEVVRAREVAGGHVQLTYGVDGKTPATPSDTVTFGSKSTPWTGLAGGYSTNTGSGVKGVNAIQMCDCDVPVGQSLGYKVTVTSAYDGTTVTTLSINLTTSGKYDASVISPPVQPDGGVLPWAIPDPVEVQGLDCAVECSATVPQGTGGATGSGGAQGTGGATVPVTTEPTDEDKGGTCSMVQGGQPAGLFLLVLGLGLAIFGRRKHG